jgi:hypothetical protein
MTIRSNTAPKHHKADVRIVVIEEAKDPRMRVSDDSLDLYNTSLGLPESHEHSPDLSPRLRGSPRPYPELS